MKKPPCGCCIWRCAITLKNGPLSTAGGRPSASSKCCGRNGCRRWNGSDRPGEPLGRRIFLWGSVALPAPSATRGKSVSELRQSRTKSLELRPGAGLTIIHVDFAAEETEFTQTY